MRFIDTLCPPALLYLLYIVIQVGLDISLGLFLTAAVKVVMGLAGTVILDALCGVDLGIVAWAIIATPFIMTALATSISLGLGLDRMMAKYVKENFIDQKDGKHKEGDALPVSTDSTYTK